MNNNRKEMKAADLAEGEYYWVVRKGKKPIPAIFVCETKRLLQFKLFGCDWYTPKTENMGISFWVYYDRPEWEAPNA